MQSTESRFEFIHVPTRFHTRPFEAVVAEGLAAAKKWLPCRFFYDRVGSELFERICNLPEYYLTRTERAILERAAGEMIEAAGSDIAIVEFGSGSSCKTRLLLDAALNRQRSLHYMPIDISADFLRLSALTLLEEYDRLSVTAIGAEYHDGIAALPDFGIPRLILFLGSSLGNFTHTEATRFLTHIRRQMQPCDRLLIGIDLLKSRPIIEAAYNDSEGVTAAFNKNLLARINAELGADFDLDCFEHCAPFVEAESRIEMHLVARHSHTVHISKLQTSVKFRQGETIHTENSHKYSLHSFASLCHNSGLICHDRWHDEKEWFAVLMLKPETR